MAAAAQTGDAYVDGLLAQLAAAERRAEQAEQAHQASEQTRQITEQDLRLADLKIQKLTLELAYYKRLHYAAKSKHYHGQLARGNLINWHWRRTDSCGWPGSMAASFSSSVSRDVLSFF